jgi:predicted nuclease with TOPRIM domain
MWLMWEKLIRAIRVLAPKSGDLLVVQVDDDIPSQQVADSLEDSLRRCDTGEISVVVVPRSVDIHELDQQTLNKAGYFKKKDE